jgi:hypothetical protein
MNSVSGMNNSSPTGTLDHSAYNNNNTSSISNHHHHHHHHKSIDMNTATNVFDFLLTNHAELFPGEINFLTGAQSYMSNDKLSLSSSSSFTVKQMLASSGSLSKANELLNSHQAMNNSSASIQSRQHQTTPLLGNISEQHVASNRYSVMINDTSMSELNSSSHSKFNNTSLFSPSSTSLINTVPSSSVNVARAAAAQAQAQAIATRHSKKNSMDSKFSAELSVSNANFIDDGDGGDSSSSPPDTAASGSFMVSGKLGSQMNASSTISLEYVLI